MEERSSIAEIFKERKMVSPKGERIIEEGKPIFFVKKKIEGLFLKY